MEQAERHGSTFIKKILSGCTTPATVELRDQETGHIQDVIPARIFPRNNPLWVVDIYGQTIHLRQWDKLIEEPRELGDLD